MIKEKLALVPNLPGCYIMKNKDGKIIYVGKAKILKNRLKSYFNGTHTGKTYNLVNNIYDFEYIITNNEMESLILEINLIKKYNPKYNILLKDDKTYPYIEFCTNSCPYLKIVRYKKIKKNNKNKLFGPYPNVTSAKETVALINRIYPLRKCDPMRKKLCLYYHINECMGYCEKKIEQDKIDRMIKDITTILNGNGTILINKLKNDMEEYSNSLQYEKANEVKNLIINIEKTINKQIIDSKIKYNFDAFGYYIKENYISFYVIFIRDGRVFEKYHKIINSVVDEKDALEEFIINFYQRIQKPNEIVVPDILDRELLEKYLEIKVQIPKRGDVKKILDLTIENAKIKLDEKIEILKKDDTKKEAAIKTLKNLLSINSLDRIELYDNSHLFGTYYTSGMVVFNNFEKMPKEYRKFKISSSKIDDLAAMREVIYRRYYRVLLEKLPKADLIIVDGGEMQVSAVKEILDQLNIKIKIIGLKKDEHHRTNIIVDEDLNEIILPKDSNLFLYLTKMQDEVHRYAISFHRDIKSKGALASILDNIDGIGEKRKKLLLKKYGSLNKMKEANIDDLSKLVSKNIAINLQEELKKL